MTLNCTANQVDNLFTPPTITWRDPDGTPVSTEGGSNPRVDPETRQLIFSDINSRNQGTYTCQAVVNIPQALITNYIDMDTTEVNTNSECLFTFLYNMYHVNLQRLLFVVHIQLQEQFKT